VNASQLGIPLPPPWVGTPTILLTEFILTFLLMTAIYGTAVDERAAPMKLGGFAVGLTVAFCILAAGPVTGASMNPARSFGPALVFRFFDHHWCYWVAPIAGAIAAALVYEYLLLERPEKEEAK
jgi:glycerol uptake facilitator-like aquaporin